MEDTLRAIRVRIARMSRKSLNPCFNGRYSQREALEVATKIYMS